MSRICGRSIRMKSLIRRILITALTIGAISTVVPGLSYSGRFGVLVVAALVLTLSNIVLTPLFKIALLPITIVTMGLLGWLANVLVLYVVTLLVDGFSVSEFSVHFLHTTLVFSKFLAFVIISFLLNLVSRLIGWLFE